MTDKKSWWDMSAEEIVDQLRRDRHRDNIHSDSLNTVEGLVAYWRSGLAEGERLAVPKDLLPDFIEKINPKTELDLRYSYGVYYIRQANPGEN